MLQKNDTLAGPDQMAMIEQTRQAESRCIEAAKAGKPFRMLLSEFLTNTDQEFNKKDMVYPNDARAQKSLNTVMVHDQKIMEAVSNGQDYREPFVACLNETDVFLQLTNRSV